jgi:hypothetical protein
MDGSRKRVLDVMHGRTPDQIPLYELIRNDAVIKHFSGRDLTVENAEEVLFEVFPKAVDTTRGVRLPSEPSDTIMEDGRRHLVHRWTQWTEHVHYDTSDDYAEAKRKSLDTDWEVWNNEHQEQMDNQLTGYHTTAARLGEDFFFFSGGPGLGLMGIFGEVGLEQFCYALADHPGVFDDLLEKNATRSVLWIEKLPKDHGIISVFSGDDIAFKGGPLLSPRWFDDHYMERFKRVVDAYHRRGINVNFHSDGDLMPIMDGLVDAGIDMLNPIETAAGMDIAELHRRYPKLVLAGGVDVSNLLPFGTPQEVFDATVKAIDDCEGQIMIGSSTELQDCVPLENFLAMRRATMEYRI